MHILPNSKIPFPNIPLDILISNKISHLKVQQERALEEAKQLIIAGKSSSSKHVSSSPVKKTAAAEQPNTAGVLKVDEYAFPHAIVVLEGGLNEQSLMGNYNKCYNYLKLEEN